MTGYGRTEEKIGDTVVVIEIRSVNSRFLEFVMRIPRGYEVVEDKTRTYLQSILGRGRVTVSLNLGTDQAAIGRPHLNPSLLSDYDQISKEGAGILGHADESLPLAELLRFPDVITYSSSSEKQAEFNNAIMAQVKTAADQLQAMRLREGQLLEEVILNQLDKLEAINTQIREADNGRLDEIAERIRNKIAEIGVEHETQVDVKRIEQEVVLWSDKLDIAEELTRLDAHIQHFRELMKDNGDAGKRLNFLLQEMNREANTIGSKANSTSIGHAVVELKNEIERIREQIQNIQ